MANPRDKGIRGELEWRDFLRDLGIDAQRGRQYSGHPDAPDVRTSIAGMHHEVKRTERLRIHEAMEQAAADCAAEDVPIVAYRRNRAPWLVIFRAFDWEQMAVRFLTAKGYRVDPPASAHLTCEACQPVASVPAETSF